jgi:TM2 domain-containing membrane protein YozV
MTKFCINCREPIANENTVVCSSCGKPLSNDASYFDERYSSKDSAAAPKTKTTTSYFPSTQTKNPIVALVLSFLWIGLGQTYNGNFRKGLFFIFAFLIGLCCFILPGAVVWIWNVWDAYTDAKKINRGELPYIEPTVWKMIGTICISYIGLLALLFVFIFFFTILIPN